MGQVPTRAGLTETTESMSSILGNAVADMKSMASSAGEVTRVLDEVSAQIREIHGFSESIRGIATQTQLLAVNAGMPAWLACAMSAVVFGGASQMILTQLWSAGTPALIIAFTVAMVNLRHALYSATAFGPAPLGYTPLRTSCACISETTSAIPGH